MRVRKIIRLSSALLFRCSLPEVSETPSRIQIVGCAVGALRIGLRRGAVCGATQAMRVLESTSAAACSFTLLSICRFAFSLRGLLCVCHVSSRLSGMPRMARTPAAARNRERHFPGQGVHGRAQGISGVQPAPVIAVTEILHPRASFQGR